MFFIVSIYFIIQYRQNLRVAASRSKDALYPANRTEMDGILIPPEWRRMEPLSKQTKSYQYVKWATIITLVLLTVLLTFALTTDILHSSFLSFAYLFFTFIRFIKHKGNLYILSDGLILNGKIYSFYQIKYFETEQIVRWHELYGLDYRVNNRYKLSFKIKHQLTSPYFVIESEDELNRIVSILSEYGISRSVENDTSKVKREQLHDN